MPRPCTCAKPACSAASTHGSPAGSLPASLDATLTELAAHGHDDDTATASAQAARDRIAGCDRQICQYRASLDAGADPAVIGPWIAETQAKRVAAQAEIRAATGRRTMTRQEI